LNKLGNVSGNTSIFSDNNSNNENNDVALMNIAINDDSDKEEATCKTFLWETVDNCFL
jgi:hypothetical protein